jgi:hypothetical protein
MQLRRARSIFTLFSFALMLTANAVPPLWAVAGEHSSLYRSNTLYLPPIQDAKPDDFILDLTLEEMRTSVRAKFEWEDPRTLWDSILEFGLTDHIVDDLDIHLEFDFQSETVTGQLSAKSHRVDAGREGEHGIGSYEGTLTDGWVRWNEGAGGWEFGGTFNLVVSIEERAWQSSIDYDADGTDDERDFEDVSIHATVPAVFSGASGTSPDGATTQHLTILFEGENVPGTGQELLELEIGFFDDGVDFSKFPGQEADDGGLPLVELSAEYVEEPETSSESGLISDKLHAMIVDFLQWGEGDIDSIISQKDFHYLTFNQQHALQELLIEVQAIRLAQMPTGELEALLTAVNEEANALGPEGQRVYDAMRLKKFKENRDAELLQDALADTVSSWKRIEMVTNRERVRNLGGSRGDTLVWIVDNSGIIKGIVDAASHYAGWVTDPAAAAQSAAEEMLKEEANITSMEDAVDKAVVLMSEATNAVVVTHYTYYYQEYMKLDDNLSFEVRHTAALEKLRERFLAPSDSAIKTSERAYTFWRDSYAVDTEPGGLYDRAFRLLGGLKPPGKVE